MGHRSALHESLILAIIVPVHPVGICVVGVMEINLEYKKKSSDSLRRNVCCGLCDVFCVFMNTPQGASDQIVNFLCFILNYVNFVCTCAYTKYNPGSWIEIDPSCIRYSSDIPKSETHEAGDQAVYGTS